MSECKDALGIEDLTISDNHINGSSNRLPTTTFGPHKARLHGSSSWCSVVNTADQYLQVDFQEVKMIKGVSIQGNPNDDEWVKGFTVSYGMDLIKWVTVMDGQEPKVIDIRKTITS